MLMRIFCTVMSYSESVALAESAGRRDMNKALVMPRKALADNGDQDHDEYKGKPGYSKGLMWKVGGQ
jgi:hypothetical protein